MQDTGKVAVRPIDTGLDLSRNPVLLPDGASPDCENVDFDRESVSSTGGAIKLGNRSAPRAALRTRVDRGNSPLSIRLSSGQPQSIPVRGYGWLRFREEYDIGGDFAEFSSTNMHTRRGVSFERQVTFTIPPEEKFAKNVTGASAGAATNFLTRNIYLDECFTIIQKGGNGLHPMSWALAVVNVGSPEVWNTLYPSTPFTQRTSTYALCWIWLDMAEWTNIGISAMRYLLTDGDASTGSYSTGAWRCIVTEQFVEPGKTYHASVALTLDSGTVGTPAAPTTNWNDDGSFVIRVSEDGRASNTYSFTDDAGGGSASGMAVWKGPTDSMRYFTKYGVRFSMKSREYIGLGHRFHPHNDSGWIPFGVDSAPLEKGGYAMVDHSALGATERDAIYLTTTTHAGVDAFVTVPAQYIVTGVARENHRSPIGPWSGTPPVAGSWNGLGFGGTIFNPEALRGYRFVQYGDASAAIRGGLLNIESYSEGGGQFRLTVTGGASLGAWVTDRASIQAFRWNQRELEISDYRMYSTPRTWTERTEWSLKTHLDMGDLTEEGLEKLVFYLPLDDGEGGVLREMVSGFDGYTAPFTMPQGTRGTRGKGQLALSGEGEALQLDLSTNPIFKREFLHNLKDGKGGFALEFTAVFPEAVYGVPVDDPDSSVANDFVAEFAPYIASWEIKDPQTDGFQAEPKPLLRLGYRIRTTSGLLTAYRNPFSFRMEVAAASDQLDTVMTTAVAGSDDVAANAPWDVVNTPWVGETITIQFGVEPTAVVDTYRVYVAATPKKFLKPAAGDPSDAEFAYFTSLVISKKDLERSVITIGGLHKPGLFGFSTLNCCMILDEVRVWGAPAPGALPTVSGQAISDRTGKLLGFNSLPSRELDIEDILTRIGPSVTTANVTESSPSVGSPGEMSFFQGDPAATIEAARASYLIVTGDDFQNRSLETLFTTQEEFYWVNAISSDGKTLTLTTAYNGESKDNAAAALFRLFGYTSFSDDLFGRALGLGSGSTFKPGTTLTTDATVTADLFFNKAPVTGNWRLRVYSPLSSASAADVAPRWVQGHKEAKTNPIRGMHTLGSQVFAAAASCVFIADDRWRFLPVNGELTTWFEFLYQYIGRSAASAPLVEDRIEFASLAGVELTTANLEPDAAPLGQVWDLEVWLDDVRGIQTLLWIGSATSDPLQNAGTGTNDHRLNHWLRLVNGRPEIVVGCSSNFSGGAAPPSQGLYAATSKRSIRSGERTHIRFALSEEDVTNHWLLKPKLWINGKPVDLSIDTVETGATGNEWVKLTDIGSAASANGRILVGTARDAYDEPEPSRTFTINTIPGLVNRPSLLRGFVHTLRGRLRRIVIGRDSAANVAALSSFNPDNLTYAATFTKFFDLPLTEGVGHRVFDAAGVRYGTIWSHPCTPVFAELGLSEKPVSFASFDNRIYATGGGRPMVWDSGFGGRFAGVLPPLVAPLFTIDRRPLWTQNVSGGTGVPTQTPVIQAPNMTEDQILHFSNYGNNFLAQVFHKEMAWEKGDTLHFKCLVKLRDTAGRIPLFDARTSTRNGGPFIEIRDGKLVIGWYDTLLKEEETVETTAPVFNTDSWHDVLVSKRFPQADSLEGNWDNSYPNQTVAKVAASAAAEGPWLQMTLTGVGPAFADGDTLTAGATTAYVMKAFAEDTTANTQVIQVRMTSNNTKLTAGAATGLPSLGAGTVPAVGSQFPLMRDRAIVKRFAKSATRETEWDAKTDGIVFNAVGFTTAASPSGCTATGIVTTPSHLYRVDAVGAVTARDASDTGVLATFHADHVGMFFQFGAGTNSGKLWRVTAFTSATIVSIALADGTAFAAAGGVADATSRAGGVFIGIGLKKSTNFALSKSPDDAVYDFEAFGSQLVGNPTNGIAPFNGEFDSFGWTSTTSHDAFRAAPTDPIETGTDTFAAPIYNGTAPGALDFDAAGNNFTVVHERTTPQVSTQPNEDLEVAQSANASANADPLLWRSIRNIQTLNGSRRIRVTFLDVDQNEESNPSPELVITPAAEDLSNPSGTARVLLTNLPVSADRGRIWRNVYMSLIDGATPLFIGTIPDNTSTSFSIFKEESEIAAGQAVQFANFAPPRCAALATSQRTMFYGNVEGQPDGVQFSAPFRPGNVPAANFLIFGTGENSPIQAMADLQGRLIVFKRKGLFSVRVEPGVAVQDTITTGSGAVSPTSVAVLDDILYYVDPRGPYALPSQGQPVFIGGALHDYFDGGIEKQSLARIAGAFNRKRSQYVFTARDATQPLMDRRFSYEINEARGGMGVERAFKAASYRGPNITALASVDDKAGGAQILVGGTEEGYIVWMDRSDTSLAMLGPGEAWGARSLVASAPGSTVSVGVTGTTDVEFSGPRGAYLRWMNGTVEQRATVLFASATKVYFDRPVSSPPANAAALVLGALRPYWKTKWFDLGVTFGQKRTYYLDVTRTVGTGSLVLETRRDFVSTILDTLSLPLNVAFGHLPTTVKGDFIQASFREPFAAAGTSFELTDLVWRADVTDQH